jgi:dCMP deaminase
MRDKEFVFMTIANVLSTLGTCDREQVGALIIHDGRCISWGYNGAPPGMPHCDENGHGWREWAETWHRDHHREEIGPSVEELIETVARREGCRNSTHAEANALAFAARQGISTDGGTLYVTVSPCEVCARLLIAAGIQEVIYGREYRDGRGIQTLIDGGVACRISAHSRRISGTS